MNRFHPFRLLVAAIIFLAVAIFSTQTGVWSTVSQAWGVGNPNAVVGAPEVPGVPDADATGGPDTKTGDSWLSNIPGLGSLFGDDGLADDADAVTGATAQRASDDLAILDTITVAEPYAKTDYAREAFAPGSTWSWDDADNDGCDTRAEILMRDLDGGYEVRDKDCYITDGIMSVEPYTGQANRAFDAHGDYSEKLDIEHAVALGDAWFSGAWDWTPEQRVAFANDPRNLFAADPSNNRSHSDKSIDLWPNLATEGEDAANEMPNRAFLCEYAAIQTEIKAAYGLSMSPEEADVMRGYLTDCATS